MLSFGWSTHVRQLTNPTLPFLKNYLKFKKKHKKKMKFDHTTKWYLHKPESVQENVTNNNNNNNNNN